MNIIYQSRKFDESQIDRRYALKFSDGTVKIFDVNAKAQTIREYWVRREELSAENLAIIDSNERNQIRIF